MRDGPSGAVLLAIARAKLLGELLPCLPRDQVYTARMIANAMAIAARELSSNRSAVATEEAARIAAFYRSQGLPAPPLDVSVDAMERVLAANIRSGRLDAAGRALLDLLEWQVAGRLRLANPKLVEPDNSLRLDVTLRDGRTPPMEG
ncbi:MAG: DUF6285 domain-containing protein [Acetobacteraceae bacterium]